MIQALTGSGAALSFFLLLVLAVKRPFRPADRWLAIWFLGQCIFCVCGLLGIAAPSGAALAALMVGQFALFVTWPAHYLYAARTLGTSPRLGRQMGLAAAAAMLVLALPLVMPISVAAGALVTEVHSPWPLLLPLTGFAVASAYPLGVLRLVTRRRESLKDHLADVGTSDPDWLRVWAWSILAVNVGSISASANSFVTGWPANVQMALLMTMQVAHVAYVGQRGLTRPGVFFPPLPVLAASRQRQPVDRVGAAEDYSRVQALLVTDKPHLLPHLTAEMLADRLGWGPERLTAALRHGGGVNFFDAVNAARAREVQQLASKPANARVSLLVLAHEAGFGSKSAFYEAFRRHVGCTPAEWRRRQADQAGSEVLR